MPGLGGVGEDRVSEASAAAPQCRRPSLPPAALYPPPPPEPRRPQPARSLNACSVAPQRPTGPPTPFCPGPGITEGDGSETGRPQRAVSQTHWARCSAVSSSNHVCISRSGFSLWWPHSPLPSQRAAPSPVVSARVPRRHLIGLDWITWCPPLSQSLWQKGMQCSDWPDLVTCPTQQLREWGAYQNHMEGTSRFVSGGESGGRPKGGGVAAGSPISRCSPHCCPLSRIAEGFRALRHLPDLQRVKVSWQSRRLQSRDRSSPFAEEDAEISRNEVTCSRPPN